VETVRSQRGASSGKKRWANGTGCEQAHSHDCGNDDLRRAGRLDTQVRVAAQQREEADAKED
jgi:hypothetical protein